MERNSIYPSLLEEFGFRTEHNNEIQKLTARWSQSAKSWRSVFIPIFKKEVNPNDKTERTGVEIAAPMLNCFMNPA